MSLLAAALLFAKSYLIEGLVLEVNRESATLLVSHKEVPGVMPAMAMPVRVKHVREMAGLRTGDMVEFQLLDGVARRLRVRRAANEIEQDGRRIPLAPPPAKVEVGAMMPGFTLQDQAGRYVHLDDLRGRVVVVEFLYTRCPMAEVCPRLAATFARLHRRFRNREDLALVSITLDPGFDNPQVLSRYATVWRADGVAWRFLTGSEQEIRTVAARFGIVYWPEEGVLTHTSTIGIVGRGGRLEALVEGLSFTAQQLGDLVEHELGKEK